MRKALDDRRRWEIIGPLALPFTLSSLSPPLWPYVPTLEKIGLALALGLFVGFERERRGKEAGLRTFGFAALLGALGGLLGEHYALFSLVCVLALAIVLNVQSLRAGQGSELTTSAALIVTAFAGVLCGLGHSLVPSAVAVVSAALLAWKDRLTGFSKTLTDIQMGWVFGIFGIAYVIFDIPGGYLGDWMGPRKVLMRVVVWSSGSASTCRSTRMTPVSSLPRTAPSWDASFESTPFWSHFQRSPSFTRKRLPPRDARTWHL